MRSDACFTMETCVECQEHVEERHLPSVCEGCGGLLHDICGHVFQMEQRMCTSCMRKVLGVPNIEEVTKERDELAEWIRGLKDMECEEWGWRLCCLADDVIPDVIDNLIWPREEDK